MAVAILRAFLCALPTSAHSAKPGQTNAYRCDASHVMALRRSRHLESPSLSGVQLVFVPPRPVALSAVYLRYHLLGSLGTEATAWTCWRVLYHTSQAKQLTKKTQGRRVCERKSRQ